MIYIIEELIPEQWHDLLSCEYKKDYFKNLDSFLENEYSTKVIYPSKQEIFNALKLVAPSDVKVVIIGQDPYHEPNQAHGLSFSVINGNKLPKSLINIYSELESDIGCKPNKNGCLTSWANQGVLLLNSVLTVREHVANTHENKGWENFTKKIVEIVLKQSQPKVFILWGKNAKNIFFSVYNKDIHKNVFYIQSAHPSPLSAYRGFWGSKPFSKTNQFLKNNGINEIRWESIFE